MTARTTRQRKGNRFSRMANSKPFQAPTHGACGVLTSLTREHLPDDLSFARRRRISKGAELWLQTDLADRMYFLTKGQIVLMTSNSAGRETIQQVINSGQPFGELCFCAPNDGRRESTARAVTDSDVLEVTFESFLTYLRQNQKALLALVFTFCLRLSEAHQRAELLMIRGAEGRLGGLLLQLASARTQTPDDPAREVPLPISHEQLSQTAAMSRPNVTVTLVRLRRRGLIRYKRGGPLVINPKALATHLRSKNKD